MEFNADVVACVDVDGRPVCALCGTGVPWIEHTWCSRECERKGRALLATLPSPRQIKRRARAVRKTWSREEWVRRADVRQFPVASRLSDRVGVLPVVRSQRREGLILVAAVARQHHLAGRVKPIAQDGPE